MFMWLFNILMITNEYLLTKISNYYFGGLLMAQQTWFCLEYNKQHLLELVVAYSFFWEGKIIILNGFTWVSSYEINVMPSWYATHESWS